MKTAMNNTYEERLRLRIKRGGAEAVDAALALMERHDPDSLEGALALVLGDAEIAPAQREIVAMAWDRYFHIRAMPWE
jgi:hypothetical protein